MGYGLEGPIERNLGTPATIAVGLIGGAIAMAVADRSPQTRGEGEATAVDAVWLGIAQACALMPGVSRNGATLAAARWRRFNREEANRLSRHVALPIIAGATFLKVARLRRRGLPPRTRVAFLAGAGASLLSTLGSTWLISQVERDRSLLPYAAYRVALGAYVLRRIGGDAQAPETRLSALLGTTLSGRYHLEARIGSGGMSTVYRALDETLERPVAVKVLNREVARDADQLDASVARLRAVAQLSHPNVVGVIDAGEDDNRPYIVFEYVDGENLKDRIRRNGHLPITESIAYCIEIARALAAAHDHQIVHRDVKPQNVLIDREGAAKVTDFGIARTLDEEGLTADGRVLGTTDYVAPEQALGHGVTGQSDLYSLGIALFEMLTGDVPFKGDNQVAVAMKHVREPLPDVRTIRQEISAALAQ